MVSEVVSPGAVPEPSSAVAGSSLSAKPFTNKSISIRLDETNYLLWRQQVLFAIDSLALVHILMDRRLCLLSILLSMVFFYHQDNAFALFFEELEEKRSVDARLSCTDTVHCDSLAACGNPLTETMHISTILSGLPSEYEPVVAVITSSQQPYKLDGVCSVLLDTEAQQQEVHSIPVNFTQGSFGFGNGFSHNLSSFSSPMSGSWGEFGPAGFVGQASSSDVNGPQFHGGSRRFSQDSFRAQKTNLANPSAFQGGRSNFYRGRGGRVYGGRSRPQFQLCGRVGHLVNRCYYRFDQSYDGFYSANFVEEAVDVHGLNAESTATQDLGGIVALVSGDFSPVVWEDVSWFPNSGATAHLTPDAGMLHNFVPYVGAGKISVANGESIPISHVGNSMLSSNSRSLVLTNLLHVPFVKKNMLSVSKFTKDNNVSIEFFPDSCVVKDLQTRRVMLQGVESSGLYKLSSSSLLQQPSGSCMSECSHIEGEEVCFSVFSILGACNNSISSNVARLSELELWHRRVGHPSEQTLAKTLQIGMFPLLPTKVQGLLSLILLLLLQRVLELSFYSPYLLHLMVDFSPVVVEVPSSGGCVSQHVVLTLINARGSRSAPIVYRRKAKAVCDQQQSIAENSCLQPAQDISGVLVDSSVLQPVQGVSISPVASPDLQSNHSVSVQGFSGRSSSPNVHEGSD
ncbi:hypothetical protein GQ457_12G006140 [Hibiscus cannabinus]